jgi:hypothetical protein
MPFHVVNGLDIQKKDSKPTIMLVFFCHILLCSLSFGRHAGIVYTKYYVTRF